MTNFNWIHEELLNRFQFIQQQTELKDFHFSAMQEAGREDWGNIDYLAGCGFTTQAGHIHQLAIEDVGYDKDSQQFLDLNNQPIDCLF